jgi:hypothetical protein
VGNILIKKLTTADFDGVINLAQPYVEHDRLPFNYDVARDSYRRMLTDKRCLAVGEFEDDMLVGAIGMGSGHNTYAQKQHASLVFWFGSIALLDYGIEWAMSRPVVRCVMVMFDREVRNGIYNLLRQRGFERCGDMRVLWR